MLKVQKKHWLLVKLTREKEMNLYFSDNISAVLHLINKVNFGVFSVWIWRT